MGINTHYYTVYGVKIGFDNEFNDAYDELYDEFGKSKYIDIISDGMGGEYIVIGKILFDSGDLRYSDFKDTFVEIDENDLLDIKSNAFEAFMEIAPEHISVLTENNWQIMTFMHLS